MKKLFLFILTLFIPFVICAEEVKLEWKSSFGGNGTEGIATGVVTDDGGYVGVGGIGSTNIEGLTSKGGRDGLIVRYDKDGNLVWMKNWGGNSTDWFNQVFKTQNDEFIVFGRTSSSNIDGITVKGVEAAVFIKYDGNGDVVWQKSIRSDGYGICSLFLPFEDGFLISINLEGYEVEGLTPLGAKDAVLIKFDYNGKIIWAKNWGGSDIDIFSTLQMDKNGDFLITGYTYSTNITGLTNFGDKDGIVIKMSSNGEILWQKSWGGSAADQFIHNIILSDGSFVTFGRTSSSDIEGLNNNGNQDVLIIKYDKNGEILWKKNFGTEEYDNYSAAVNVNDEIVFVLGAISMETYDTLWYKLYKIDNNGNTLYERQLDIVVNKMYSIGDNFFIIGCNFEGNADYLTVKYNSNCEEIWREGFGGSDIELLNLMLQISNNEYYVSGSYYSTDIEGIVNRGHDDYMIMKYSIDYNLEPVDSNFGVFTLEKNNQYGVITPTPNEGYEVDKIIIKDKDGNVLDVEITKLEDGNYSFDLYTDVSVEVLFKEKLVNPKTGVVSYIGAILLVIGLSVCSLLVLLFRKKHYSL